MMARARPAGRMLAQGVVAATLQLVRAMQGGRDAADIQILMGQRQGLLTQLARKMDDPDHVGSLTALQAAVAESDRALGALLG
jgi:hypothetical protein